MFREPGLLMRGIGGEEIPQLISQARKSPANSAGESSFKCTGTTPQAPCTMNCMKNPPAIRSGSVGEKIQAGIRRMPSTAADDNRPATAPALRKNGRQSCRRRSRQGYR